MAARARLREAEAAVADLGDLDAARAEAEDAKITVEAARITMMTRRSAHDELRREGEARERRRQESDQGTLQLAAPARNRRRRTEE